MNKRDILKVVGTGIDTLGKVDFTNPDNLELSKAFIEDAISIIKDSVSLQEAIHMVEFEREVKSVISDMGPEDVIRILNKLGERVNGYSYPS